MLTTKLAHTSARRSALWSLRSAHLANSQLTNTDSVANCHGEADRPTAAAPEASAHAHHEAGAH